MANASQLHDNTELVKGRDISRLLQNAGPRGAFISSAGVSEVTLASISLQKTVKTCVYLTNIKKQRTI